MSEAQDKHFSEANHIASPSKLGTKRILISYNPPAATKSNLPESKKLKPGERKVIVIEKLKRSTSFDSTMTNYQQSYEDLARKGLVRGRLSPSCKKEIFIAKKPEPDENEEGSSMNYICFSNVII